jgi:delta 1-pyrroline-5-carboxylate dehydrogenase
MVILPHFRQNDIEVVAMNKLAVKPHITTDLNSLLQSDVVAMAFNQAIRRCSALR